MEKYTVQDYIEVLKEIGEVKDLVNCQSVLDKVVNHLSYNSKEVVENTMFVCKGASFKVEYLKEAIKAGVFVYVSDKIYDVNIPCVLVKDIQRSLSSLSAMYFNYPGESINVIGVGGTKGKSTTTYYIKAILDEYAKKMNQKETAVISSIDTYDGVENFESHITTPESYDIHKHFFNALNSGMENVVMEVSSQALKKERVADVFLDIGIFMNISEDHISPIEHQDFNDYYTSKLKMFANTKNAIINMDADYAKNTLEVAQRDSSRVFTFSMKTKDTDFYAYDIRKDGFHTLFKVHTPSYDDEFILTMPGLFNVENALAAIATAYIMDIPVEFIQNGLKIARSSGRMEVFHTKDMKIIILVDYAHNKLSFEKLFSSVKEEYKGRRIVAIFGCPGKKALLRRKDLGTVAGMNSDFVYLVAEDPGAEPVIDISNDIAKYVKQYTDHYALIEERGEAIEDAVLKAEKEETPTIILLTGKGRETRQKYGSEYLPCISDVEYTERFLKEYDERHKN
ncbi:MAG: UDP-N-acetylmuramoyl-L-alanyl-D-glutamate--2,6-diaminopimelate ligase [Clostridia bacterium]|nr:UDP-N-acetylmuramoyl-L-alanyl-D-glutamate--2,6-diaminopimelate ligase [Clostridia bacterium]